MSSSTTEARCSTRPAYGNEKPQPHDPPLRFNLRIDPSERFNVADQHPDVVAEITKTVERHRTTATPGPN